MEQPALCEGTGRELHVDRADGNWTVTCPRCGHYTQSSPVAGDPAHITINQHNIRHWMTDAILESPPFLDLRPYLGDAS